MPEKVERMFRLRRVRLNAGGYDRRGTYWGLGLPLYNAQCDTDGNDINYHLRANSRDNAKHMVQHDYPGARFYK